MVVNIKNVKRLKKKSSDKYIAKSINVKKKIKFTPPTEHLGPSHTI